MGGLRPFHFGTLGEVKKLQKDTKTCFGKHYIYVAEVVYVPKTGTVHLVHVCRACGEVSFHEKEIAPPSTPAILLKEKEKENVV